MATYQGDKLPRDIRAALEVGGALARAGFGPGESADLVSISRQLHRLAEADCSGYSTPRGEWDSAAASRAERRAAKLETMAAGIVARAIEAGRVPAGTRCHHQTDPQGCALYICGPEVREPINTHYDHGVAVY